MNLYNLVCDTVFFKNSKYLGKIVLTLFRTFVVVAAILASPKRRVFIWSYRSSIYRVHWSQLIWFNLLDSCRNLLAGLVDFLQK